MAKTPKQYQNIKKKYAKVHEAVNNLGKTIKKAGPLNRKTAELIQLAAAAAIRSEGSVHSHARRAMQAGATKKELNHAVLLLTSTIGFPTVSAALCWIEDVTEKDG